MNTNDRFRLKRDLVVRNILGLYFIVDLNEKHYFNGKNLLKLNYTGYQFITYMKALKNFSVEELVQKLVSSIWKEIDADIIRHDLFQFVELLLSHGLILNEKENTINLNQDLSSNSFSKAKSKKENLRSIPQFVNNYWGPKRHIFNAGIELTSSCNLRCVHCYNQNESHKTVLSLKDVKVILDELYSIGTLFIYFTGGEILSRPDFLDIYLYAKKKGFIIELLTNGTLLTDEIIHVFEKYPPANVSISVYGGEKETFGKVTQKGFYFDLLMNNLNKLKKAGIEFEIKFIGMDLNIQDFDKVRILARVLEVPFRYAFELFPALHGPKENTEHQISIDKIIEIEKNDREMCKRLSRGAVNHNNIDAYGDCLYKCSISRYMILIDFEGYINPCTVMRSKKFNILKGELGEAWEYFGKYITEKAPKDYKCASCKNYYFCSPCVEKNKLFTGSKYTPVDFHCKLVEARRKEFSKSAYDLYRKK